MRYIDNMNLLVSHIPEIVSDKKKRQLLSFMYEKQAVDVSLLENQGFANVIEPLEECRILTRKDNRLSLTKAGQTIAYGIREYELGLESDYMHSLLEKLSISDNSVILDAGCGVGQFLMASSKYDPRRAVGMDIDPMLLALAKHLGKENKANPSLVLSSIDNLPFREASFDAIICRGVLPYVKNRMAITELCRVLKKGGKIYIKGLGFGYYILILRRQFLRKGIKHHLYYLFVLFNGILFHLTGKQLVFKRPRFAIRWLPFDTTCETFQTLSRMESLLRKEGLTIIEHETKKEAGFPRSLSIIARKD